MKSSKIGLVTASILISAVIALFLYFQKSESLADKTLSLWNKDKKYNQAAQEFLKNCLNEDAFSCQLTQLPAVQEYYSEGQFEIIDQAMDKIKNDPVLNSRKLVNEFMSTDSFSEVLNLSPQLNQSDLKYWQTHSLMAVGLGLRLYGTKEYFEMETEAFKSAKSRIANELINRNQTLGHTIVALNEKSNGNLIGSVKIYNECALKGNSECIIQNALSYAAGVGRLQSMNESIAWLNICRMLGPKRCDSKKIEIIETLITKNNFSKNESVNLSKKYEKIVVKNLEELNSCLKNRSLQCDESICDEVCE